jgi:alkylhydroperoxidase family enzyme
MLPREEPPLPAWARVLAASLPKATGAMLELDHVHRAKNPLGPVLRGKLRWVAADANRSAYGKAYAEYDLRRAGLKDDDVKQLAGDHAEMPDAERAALAFARKVTLAAYTVTDEEMAELIRLHGPEKVVAMVHTLAYANFQDRILLALGVEVEMGGPLPPLEVRFDPKAKVKTPERPPWKDGAEVKVDVAASGPQWLEKSFEDLQKTLDQQKSRALRIPLPDLKKLPPEMRKKMPTKIVWSHVSMGYQPLLTKTWFDTMGAFQQESKLDRVFANSMFWVISRSNECFY